MKLLHIQTAAVLGGCERSCELFVMASPQLEHAVAVLGSDGPACDVWRAAGAKVDVLNAGQGPIEEYAAVFGAVKRMGADAVIVWTASRAGLKVSACRMAGAKGVLVHVGNPVRQTAKNALAAEAYTFLPCGRRGVLIPNTAYVQATCRDRWGFHRFRSRFVYSALDNAAFGYRPLKAFPESVCAGMVARLDPIKDHATLLRAWAVVLERRPNWHLELAGDGPLRGRLEQLATDLGVGHRVHFLGNVSDIPALMERWALVVHSTTQEEGLGVAMLEAMSMGRPLVATDTGPVPEVTDGGRVARLCRPGDAKDLAHNVLDVQANWERSLELVEDAREWIAFKFSPRKMVEGYLNELPAALFKKAY